MPQSSIKINDNLETGTHMTRTPMIGSGLLYTLLLLVEPIYKNTFVCILQWVKFLFRTYYIWTLKPFLPMEQSLKY